MRHDPISRIEDGSPQGLSLMSVVTHILSAIEQGDAQAADQLLPLVYDELRKLADADGRGEPRPHPRRHRPGP